MWAWWVLVLVLGGATSEGLEERAASPECLRAVSFTVEEARRGEPWALNLLDASAKLPTGLLYGDAMRLGNFEQCLDVMGYEPVNGSFVGHYCMMYIRSNHVNMLNAVNMQFGICLPSACTMDEFAAVINENLMPQLGLNMTASPINSAHCFIKQTEKRPYSGGLIAFIVVSSVLFAVIVVAALLEGRGWPLADALSVRRTMRQVMSTKSPPGNLSCLHGMRVGSLFWVVLGHRYGYELQTPPIANWNVLRDYLRHPMTMSIANAMVSVDSFFFLSGLLVGLNFFKAMHRDPKFNLAKFYLLRYLRLAIPMAYVIFYYATVLPRMGTGPLWNRYAIEQGRSCQQGWLNNMLFINNYHFGTENWGMCLGQTWYTAVDMQLFWISPLLLLPLHFKPRAGLHLTYLTLVISCLIPIGFTYTCGFPMASSALPESWANVKPGCDYGKKIYNATQSRATPYLIGILLGYYLFQWRDKKFNIPKLWVWVGWLTNTALALTVVYSLAIMYDENYVYDKWGSATYAGLHRVGWSLSLAWIVFACQHGIGGPVDAILSWRGWLPMSRLSFGGFLVHFIVQIYTGATVRVSHTFSTIEAFYAFFGDLIPMFGLSLILYLLVEGPLLVVMKLIFFNDSKKTKKSATNGVATEVKENGVSSTKDKKTT